MKPAWSSTTQKLCSSIKTSVDLAREALLYSHWEKNMKGEERCFITTFMISFLCDTTVLISEKTYTLDFIEAFPAQLFTSHMSILLFH